MRIMSRAEWGAVHEDGAGPAPIPAREVWLHHSVTVAPDLVPPFDDEMAAMRTLERIGEERFGRGISYTWAVMPSGRVYTGHSPNRMGAHLAKRNSVARGIVLIGNYDKLVVSHPQRQAVVELLREAKRRGWIATARINGGHSQAPGASTVCPGRNGLAVIASINRDAAITPTPSPTLRGRLLKLTSPRMTGEDVKVVQRKLAAWYRLGSDFVDGVYDEETVQYVKRVQANVPPHPVLTADGMVGPDTRRKLGITT